MKQSLKINASGRSQDHKDYREYYLKGRRPLSDRLTLEVEDPHLPFNRAAAEARLHHLKRRFSRDPDLEAKYRVVIEEYVNKGYARKLTPEEVATRSRITWYLPHHPVFNVNKPNKCRVVFDAAAKSDGTSLNDQLYKGPNLANNLAGALIRFREEEIAFTADLEAMFHQVKVLPRNADALRFLWWSGSLNNPPPPPPDEYQMLVHIFGAASSPCCANRQQMIIRSGLARK